MFKAIYYIQLPFVTGADVIRRDAAGTIFPKVLRPESTRKYRYINGWKLMILIYYNLFFFFFFIWRKKDPGCLSSFDALSSAACHLSICVKRGRRLLENPSSLTSHVIATFDYVRQEGKLCSLLKEKKTQFLESVVWYRARAVMIRRRIKYHRGPTAAASQFELASPPSSHFFLFYPLRENL